MPLRLVQLFRTRMKADLWSCSVQFLEGARYGCAHFAGNDVTHEKVVRESGKALQQAAADHLPPQRCWNAVAVDDDGFAEFDWEVVPGFGSFAARAG